MAWALTGGTSAMKIGDVELLVGASNYDSWRRGMTTFLKTNRLWGYVEGDPSAPNSRHHDARQIAPVVPLVGATEAQEDAFNLWSFNDMTARSFIEYRISPVSLSLLPYRNYKTARDVWAAIKLLYARQDVASQFAIRDRLHSLTLKDHYDLDNYIGEFQCGRSKLVEMGVPYTEYEMVHGIIRGLPSTGSWQHFQMLLTQYMEDHLARQNISPDPADTLLSRTISRLTVECARLQALIRDPDSDPMESASELNSDASEPSDPSWQVGTTEISAAAMFSLSHLPQSESSFLDQQSGELSF